MSRSCGYCRRAWPGGAGDVLAVATPRTQPPFSLARLVPYGVWLYVAQNPHNPRHILPLLPVLLIAIASGVLTRPYWVPHGAALSRPCCCGSVSGTSRR